jgi:transketolase
VSAARRSENLRDAYGRALVELGEGDPTVVALGTDPAGPLGTPWFRDKFPDRYVRPGTDESTMMSTAADLARGGKVAFANTLAGIATGPAYPAIRRSICYDRANVKIVALHAGPSPNGLDGPYRMYEDLGLMRGLPGMTVVVPADAPSARAAATELVRHPGPAYVRLGDGELPVVTDGTFRVGRAGELREGSDLTMIAIGGLVARALDAAEELAKVGVSTRVLDFASLKPFDEAALLRAARDTGAILALEEHSVLTGLGAAVAATTSENYPVPVVRVGVPDVFVTSDASGEAVLDRYGMSLERVRDEAWELLRLRGKVQ